MKGSYTYKQTAIFGKLENELFQLRQLPPLNVGDVVESVTIVAACQTGAANPFLSPLRCAIVAENSPVRDMTEQALPVLESQVLFDASGASSGLPPTGSVVAGAALFNDFYHHTIPLYFVADERTLHLVVSLFAPDGSQTPYAIYFHIRSPAAEG